MPTKQERKKAVVNKLETAEKRVLEIKDEMVALKEELTKIMLDVADTANKAVCDGVLDFEDTPAEENRKPLETKEKRIEDFNLKKDCEPVKGCYKIKCDFADPRTPVYVLINLPVVGRKPTDILYTLEKMINVTKALINDKEHVAVILNDSISWSNSSIWEYALDNKGKFSPKSAKHYYRTHISPYIEEADVLVSPYDTYDDIVCDITKDNFYTQLRFEDFKNRNSGLKKIPFSKFDKRGIDLDTICIKPYDELKERYDNEFKEHQAAVKCKEGDAFECTPGKECEPGENMPDFLK